MSRRSITRNSVHVAMRKLGGARSTQAQRKQKVLSIVNWCFNNNHCINSIKELTGPMVKGYLESLKDTDSRKRKEATPKGCTVATCPVSCDHIPRRSWPLFRARAVLRSVIESMKQEATP